VAKAGLPEASAAIAIATTKQTIEFGMETIASLGTDRDAPRDLLLLNFVIRAAREVFYRGSFIQKRIDMLRASWRGHLRLSSVSCPIYLSPATASTKTLSSAPDVASNRGPDIKGPGQLPIPSMQKRQKLKRMCEPPSSTDR
jgi:hypothetical protein